MTHQDLGDRTGWDFGERRHGGWWGWCQQHTARKQKEKRIWYQGSIKHTLTSKTVNRNHKKHSGQICRRMLKHEKWSFWQATGIATHPLKESHHNDTRNWVWVKSFWKSMEKWMHQQYTRKDLHQLMVSSLHDRHDFLLFGIWVAPVITEKGGSM